MPATGGVLGQLKWPVDGEIALEGLARRHAAALAALITGNRERLAPWFAWAHAIQTETDALRYVDFFARRYARNGAPALSIIYNGKMAGVVNVNQIDWRHGHASLGYWIDHQRQGLGLAVRSCRRLVQHLFGELELVRVSIQCATGNKRSAEVPRRLGFTFEGTLRKAERLPHGFVDLNVYGLLSEEFFDASRAGVACSRLDT